MGLANDFFSLHGKVGPEYDAIGWDGAKGEDHAGVGLQGGVEFQIVRLIMIVVFYFATDVV